MGALKDYQITSTDWREAIRKNKRKTFNVIVVFVLIYLALGFFIDLIINADPRIPLMTTAQELILFYIPPYASLLMLLVAAISLMIAYYFHDSLMLLGTEYHEVTNDPKSSLEDKTLYNVVEELKIAAGMKFMPKIYIIEANYMNAFASGYSEKSALVAITRGLLEKLNRNELQAVMAHELTHIRNMDTRLTLTIAILSNLILIAIDLLFRGMIFGRNRDSRDNRIMLVIMLARIILPILTAVLMLFLSRTREYMADTGSVELLRDNAPLASALLKIDEDHQSPSNQKAYANTAHEEIRQSAYLYDPSAAGVSRLASFHNLFSTHPSVADRLKAIGIRRR